HSATSVGAIRFACNQARSFCSGGGGLSAAAATATESAGSSGASLQHADQGVEAGGILNAAKYGGRHHVSLIPGDGIGPELMDSVKTIVNVAGSPIDFEEIPLSAERGTDEDMRRAILSIKRNGVGLKGNLETFEGMTSKNVQLRTKLDLFAYVQRCKSIEGVPSRYSDIDILVIRENTEGEYSQLEHFNVPGVVESFKIITEAKSRQIAKFAFDTAIKTRRHRVTAVHKANIMKLSDGLFLDVCRDVARDYPSIEFNDVIVDNCCMQLVARPQQFDIMVLPNLYGNIIGNIAAGLVGGPGVAAGMNIGRKYAVFEAGTRNSGRSIRGKNIANPSALLLTTADMLEYLGDAEDAKKLRNAVLTVLRSGIRTPDLGGSSNTKEVVDAVVQYLLQVRGH
ncbi:hypothetical protein BOX15_Mlig017458g1, partial [Macrostomum lignano]